MPDRPRQTPAELRSARWFAPDDLRAYGHRSRTMQMGCGPEDWADQGCGFDVLRADSGPNPGEPDIQ